MTSAVDAHRARDDRPAAMALSPALRGHIDGILEQHRVVLFMKGTRLQPACGFSATVVGLLDAWLEDYHTVDVLADPTLREALKEYTEWPTFPQLYVGGTFVGGTDIVKELATTGALAPTLGVREEARPAPKVSASERALEVFRAASREAEGAVLRMEVGNGFEHDLFFGDAAPGDVVVTIGDGVAMHLDPASARRADGATIDYVTGARGAGFSIDNPNEPARVRSLTAPQLRAMMDSGRRFLLVDVRTEHEHELARIEGARLLDHALEHELLAMDRGTTLVFQCHHGVRSLHAAEHFLTKGFREVYNLSGGIEAWSTQVDPSVPRY